MTPNEHKQAVVDAVGAAYKDWLLKQKATDESVTELHKRFCLNYTMGYIARGNSAHSILEQWLTSTTPGNQYGFDTFQDIIDDLVEDYDEELDYDEVNQIVTWYMMAYESLRNSAMSVLEG